jgi:hypothetical protein
MCTVSIVPVKDGMVFTFNRDEMPQRATPNFNAVKELQHKFIYYPKDIKADGTWFVVDNLGNAAMLFNGAFLPHSKQEKYEKSRGLVLLAIFSSINMQSFFSEYNLKNVEPFSIILYENKNLQRLVWDGEFKHQIKLSKTVAHIFSSATLYAHSIQKLREEWLQNYLEQQKEITDKSILNFHTTFNKSDKENGLLIDRKESCKTLTVSQVCITVTTSFIKHLDLLSAQIYQQKIELATFEKV